MPGDEAGTIGEQEKDGRSDILRPTYPPDRVLGVVLRAEFLTAKAVLAERSSSLFGRLPVNIRYELGILFRAAPWRCIFLYLGRRL
jgi:hypothetical protein